MTPDTKPTLTENDIEIQSTYVAKTDSLEYWLGVKSKTFDHVSTIEEAESLKQQILTALNEYPKLKEKIEFLKSFQQDSKVLYEANIKLKAENEELKITKLHNDDFIQRLQQENESLRQLKQRIEDRIKDIESMPEFKQKEWHSVKQFHHELQLLKGK